jgi:hypothetical protein
MRYHPGWLATVLVLIAVSLLTVALAVDRQLADRLTSENGAAEWLQAGLCAACAGVALWAAWDTARGGACPVLEVLVAAMMTALVIGEVDLDRIIAGRKLIATRFLVDPAVPVIWRGLVAACLVIPPAALAVYALHRRRQLVAAIREVLPQPKGRVFVVGLVVFAFAEIFERPAGRISGLPRYFIEETLELIAAICFAVSLFAHRRTQARAPAASRLSGS